MKKILGLDLGTNSIGWALIDNDTEKQEGRIIGLGSRIIPMDQGQLGKFEEGNSISQTAERTGFRGVRRLHERNLLRRERLHRVLHVLNFLPEHYSTQIDFENRLGKFKNGLEPKLAYKQNEALMKFEFIFQDSFYEMLKDFDKHQHQLTDNNKKVPYDWTIYYLRKKALHSKISKEELAWILLNFNQKRGYFQLRGEEEEENANKKIEFHALLVTDVFDSGEKKGKDETWYNVVLENGWIYRRTSKIPLDWKGKIKEFIVTTELDENGNVKKDKEGKERRSFRAPQEDDWTLIKKKTEADIDKSTKTVGEYIYDTLLQKPDQKIKGKLVRTIERKFYKNELHKILDKQKEFHQELSSEKLLTDCISELYQNNENQRNILLKKDFTHLFINDIIFYQRPLKSKKSLISNCRYEFRTYLKDGKKETKPIKCIAHSNPFFQEFRLWQFIHNLKIYERTKLIDGKTYTDVNVTAEYLKTENDLIRLFDELNGRKEIDQKNFLKLFKLKEDAFRWNYVEDKTYPCNKTRALMIERLKKIKEIPVEFLNKTKESELWHILYSVQDKTEIEKALNSFAIKNELSENISKQFVEIFKKFPPFEKEYGSYSEKAIKKLLPFMRTGKYWYEKDIDIAAKNRIDSIMERLKAIHFDSKKINEVQDDEIPKQVLNSFAKVTNPYKALNTYQACYAVYGRHSEESESTKWRKPQDIENYLQQFKQHSLRNPIVEQVITEALRVVKDIWKHFGESKENYFDEIHIELGREMKNPADKRKEITKNVTENENTNLRIKYMLAELKNFNDIENVRPYSPSQQEILKIYEEGVLKSGVDIPDDIAKISKSAQPTKSEFIKYKLWLDQKYRSPYTGEIIPLSKLFTTDYQIEHIIPQSRYFDDSMSNKVICEAEVNKDKDNSTAYEYIKNNAGKKIELNFGKEVTLFTLAAYEDFVKRNFTGNRSKMKKLLMEDIPDKMVERQLNDTRYISKVVKNLLSNIVREENEIETTSKHVVASNGAITSILKQDWGLHDVWNHIIYKRFERLNELTKTSNFGEWTNKEGKRVFQTQIPLEIAKGVTKKRIDHRHHALDAVIIAAASRNHINYLNNEYALSDKKDFRHDLRNKLCIKKFDADKKNYKWEFIKPWNTFTQDCEKYLSSTIISFKQNLRVVNKTVNYYQKWVSDENGKLKKEFVKQTKGENWAIRKPLHKETVAGKVCLRFVKKVQLSSAFDNWNNIVDKSLKNQIKKLISQNFDKKKLIKFFKDNDNKWNGIDVSKVDIYYWDNNIGATRVKLDESFNKETIQNITDTGIQKILLNHLQQEKYQNQKDEKGKDIAPEILAFSPEGIDDMNKNMFILNNGKFHQPIYKVRKNEAFGNKFSVGFKNNKNSKFVEAAKGTNLFFAIYIDENGKRFYDSIPLNIVIEQQKQGLPPVPETYIDNKNNKEYKLLFYLSPNDLVYIPTEEEKANPVIINFEKLSSEQSNRIYKFVSCTEGEGHFVPYYYSSPIVKNEIGSNNKSQNTIDKDYVQIKAFCWKLKVNRIGVIEKIYK